MRELPSMFVEYGKQKHLRTSAEFKHTHRIRGEQNNDAAAAQVRTDLHTKENEGTQTYTRKHTDTPVAHTKTSCHALHPESQTPLVLETHTDTMPARTSR
jgi:hypothetical protein